MNKKRCLPAPNRTTTWAMNGSCTATATGTSAREAEHATGTTTETMAHHHHNKHHDREVVHNNNGHLGKEGTRWLICYLALEELRGS